MKTNSESSAAGNETASAAMNESDVQEMSSGAAMLIERMKANPDEFKYGGRFYRVAESMVLSETQRWISARDIKALRAAYEEHIVEGEFTEWVYNEIFSPKEESVGQFAVPHTANSARAMVHAKNQIAGNLIGGGFTDTRAYHTPLQGAAANIGAASVRIGNTTLTESMLTQIKTKLGL
jgi:hypothetical protein